MIRPGSKPKRPRGTGKASEARSKESKDGAEGAEEPATSSSSKKRKLNEDELKEREKRTVFVGNVPLKWTEKQLRAAIRKALGDAYDGTLKPMWFRSLPLDSQWTKTAKMRKAGRILNDFADGAESKNAYVVVRSPEDVPLIVKKINNLQADMDHILRADGVGESAVLKKFDRKRSVFIGSLPRRVTESDIRWILWEAGEVDAVRIVRDKVTQECKGFAFARFKERKSVKAALSLWDLRIHGKYVRITKVDEEMEKAASTPSARPKVNPEKEKRIMLKQQRQQRVKAKKQREFVEQAKAAGLRTSKKPPKTVKRKLKDKKKAKR
eukprot:symbB.v1.2.036144.t1/scaffold5034.1/size31624/3